MQRYSPYTAAFIALTNAPAREYYADRAIEDIATIIYCINHACNAAYQVGALLRQFVETTEANAVECSALAVSQSVAIASTQTEPEIIDAEIIEEPDFFLLSGAPEIQVQTQTLQNQTWILKEITQAITEPHLETVTQYLLTEAKKNIVKSKAKKRTPRANAKTATPAPRKSPTKEKVGRFSASID